MDLGEKLRQARLEAGLSQRALCAERITRNMLSQIEHGTARPSMDTLKYLAGQLGKPVSYFLQEDVVLSPNREIAETARRCLEDGEFAKGLAALDDYRGPDPFFDREQALLIVLLRLGLAEQCLGDRREPYARELLENTQTQNVYCAEELERRRLLLMGRLGAASLPSLDAELILRAELALDQKDPHRAARLLDAAEDQEDPRWNLLRGKAFLEERDFPQAAPCLHKAEEVFESETAPLLETCYRELGDYKLAYEYACKQRQSKTLSF